MSGTATGHATGVALGVRGLSFAYRRGTPAVIDNLSVRFEPATITTVTGSSGSGKSTLLYLLALMLTPQAGSITWNGRATEAMADSERARLRANHCGFVFQDAMLDPARTVLDNACEAALFAGVPHRLARDRARGLLEEFGVGHRADHRPGEISGGQAQRVALCRALLTDPDVIFGDEPTGNLDDASADIVWSALVARARAGATVIVATHAHTLTTRAGRQVELP